jgi:hypothetical protein
MLLCWFERQLAMVIFRSARLDFAQWFHRSNPERVPTGNFKARCAGASLSLRRKNNMANRLTMVTLLLWLAVFATSGVAQSKPSAPMAAGEALTPVAWLVGGTWVTDVKSPSDGTATHVENRTRWAANHQAIEFNVDFNGKPHYNGFYAYNPVAKTIGFYYTDSEGEMTIGTAIPDADGKTIHQEFDTMYPNGKTGRIRSTLVRDGNDAYWFAVFVQKDGDWAQVFKIHYERK